MRSGRRKRLKSGQSVDVELDMLGAEGDIVRGKQILQAAEHEAENGFHVDSGSYETGSFASRCSVRLIHEVVSKFDSYKKEIVKSCGFAGILHFPAIKQFNRRFVMWLMSRVNCDFRTLNVGDHINIRFTKSDVGHVLGIPSTGKRVVDDRGKSRDVKQRVLDKFLGMKFKEQRSIKLVQEIIEREYGYPMSKVEEDTFRVSFVIFVVSNLLAPSAKHDYASIDYWNAIEDPELLHTYDWSHYVLVKLDEAVTKLKQDLSCNIKFPLVTGCSIFLQVIYLDSLNIEGHMLTH